MARGGLAIGLGEILRAVEGVKDGGVFPVVPGETYYVDMPKEFYGEDMDLVSKREGEEIIQGCRLAESDAASGTH